jgi:hypothetical protein
MKLDVIIDGKTRRIEVPQDMLEEGETFFQKMDRDMDSGWQMGPEFVESPNTAQRCQIAANKLLVSVSARNKLLVELMAGYILKRLPGIKSVEIDTSGEMLNTEFSFDENTRSAPRPAAGSSRPQTGMNDSEARIRAESEVSQVYKVGKAFRFAVHDRASGRWVESSFSPTEEQAKQLRDEACARLAEKLMQT